jgi:hypothetical protein
VSEALGHCPLAQCIKVFSILSHTNSSRCAGDLQQPSTLYVQVTGLRHTYLHWHASRTQ